MTLLANDSSNLSSEALKSSGTYQPAKKNLEGLREREEAIQIASCGGVPCLISRLLRLITEI